MRKPADMRTPGGSQPYVSIILTCYNLGAFLDEALDSALSQTYPHIEVILVDDGSTDSETQAAVTRAARRPRVRLLQLENGGVSRARNLGIAAASGMYILPLDADDRIHPEYVAKAVAVLEERPEVGFVGCHYQTFGLYTFNVTHADYSFPALLAENTVPICSLFRRICWEQVGGYCGDLNGYEDWDLWIGIVEQGHSGYALPEILFDYRIRKGSNLDRNKQADTYIQRMQLLYARHRQSYDRYYYEVLRHKDRLFITQQADQAQLRDMTIEQRAWIAQQEQALEWHKQHGVALEDKTTQFEQVYNEQQLWIMELEKARDFHQHLAKQKQETVAHLESENVWYRQLSAERESWIQELEATRTHLHELVATREARIRELEVELARHNDNPKQIEHSYKQIQLRRIILSTFFMKVRHIRQFIHITIQKILS